ncbi:MULTISPECIES: winged helix-turn-helix domain-containing protein [unclassified Chryseobacterium]|uniref:winged helix-turn-helix domain-containing protein n=1 Tax=unclassified Chryseobacterium TaxID=2593645 RepID=UPI00285350B9|nr:crosslink repair DNA glycosylase YcaQ family protein [Chryseobacterium sp. CFS7]MDR4892588.1 crosslink repair DNA glycosylase YcaQ family protein [Chryseobacterium sp. CFS7]
MEKKLTPEHVKLATLDCQGLIHSTPFGTGKTAVLNAVEHLGYIQIDTLSMVERAHHHTLWTRIPDFQTDYLEELVEDRKVFEYWFHAASYLPMQDFRYVLPQMLTIKRGESRYYNADPKVMEYVMDTIRNEGPKRARDFENESHKAGSWWNWKPAKLALERLFMQGDLMISGRSGMQKTYDLAERVLPSFIDTTEPTPLEFAEYLVKTNLRAYGLTTVKQITHLRKGNDLKKNVNTVLKTMLDKGEISQVKIEGLSSAFIQNDVFEKTFDLKDSNIHLLSPFDNSIIHRDRIRQIFDFDFRLECYTPKEKRQYGYFCLPILYGDQFIGRVDCKAHRKEKKLELIHLHIENNTLDIELWLKPFAETIKRFAVFNGCESLTLTKVSPSKLNAPVKKELSGLKFKK